MKTFENGIIGTYIAGFSGYDYGKLFTAATKKRQSRLAWEEMSKFISIDPDLSEYFKVKDYKSVIECNATHCTIEALSKEAGLDDGFRSIFVSIDELHQHKDNSIYKALYNGTAALPETCVSMITTRGSNLNSFCKEMDDYAIKVLEGIVDAEDFFIDIYSLDDDDDVFDETCWIKANPFLATTESGMETLRNDAKTARDMGGSDLKDFITKRMNRWVQDTDDAFINTDKFAQCAGDLTLDDFRGQTCTVGIDLSSGGDLTSYSLEFEYQLPDKRPAYYFYSHSFMPKGRLEEHIKTDLAPYDLWVEQGLITITGGRGDFKNDYKFIIRDLKQLAKEYDLRFKAIGIDPHNADGILSDLEELGCPVVIVTQSCKALNDATVDIQLLTKSNQLAYNRNNGLLIWSFCNAIIVRNSFNEVKIDKRPDGRSKRIDPVDACIDAHYCVVKDKEETKVNIESALDLYLKAMAKR